MGFQTEFNSVCKFKSDSELYELLEYGRRRGIPDEQLDFEPRTVAGARERFAL